MTEAQSYNVMEWGPFFNKHETFLNSLSLFVQMCIAKPTCFHYKTALIRGVVSKTIFIAVDGKLLMACQYIYLWGFYPFYISA